MELRPGSVDRLPTYEAARRARRDARPEEIVEPQPASPLARPVVVNCLAPSPRPPISLRDILIEPDVADVASYLSARFDSEAKTLTPADRARLAIGYTVRLYEESVRSPEARHFADRLRREEASRAFVASRDYVMEEREQKVLRGLAFDLHAPAPSEEEAKWISALETMVPNTLGHRDLQKALAFVHQQMPMSPLEAPICAPSRARLIAGTKLPTEKKPTTPARDLFAQRPSRLDELLTTGAFDTRVLGIERPRPTMVDRRKRFELEPQIQIEPRIREPGLPAVDQAYVERLGKIERNLRKAFEQIDREYVAHDWEPDSAWYQLDNAAFLRELAAKQPQHISRYDAWRGIATIEQFRSASSEILAIAPDSFFEKKAPSGKLYYMSIEEMRRARVPDLVEREKALREDPKCPIPYLKRPMSDLSLTQVDQVTYDYTRYGIEKLERKLRIQSITYLGHQLGTLEATFNRMLATQGIVGDAANLLKNNLLPAGGSNTVTKAIAEAFAAKNELLALKTLDLPADQFAREYESRMATLQTKLGDVERCLQEFQKSQKSWTEAISDITSVITSIAALLAVPATGGASLAVGLGAGALGKVGVHALEAVTGSGTYEGDFLLDAASGGVNGLGGAGALLMTRKASAHLLAKATAKLPAGESVPMLARAGIFVKTRTAIGAIDGFAVGSSQALLKGYRDPLHHGLRTAALGAVLFPLGEGAARGVSRLWRGRPPPAPAAESPELAANRLRAAEQELERCASRHPVIDDKSVAKLLGEAAERLHVARAGQSASERVTAYRDTFEALTKRELPTEVHRTALDRLRATELTELISDPRTRSAVEKLLTPELTQLRRALEKPRVQAASEIELAHAHRGVETFTARLTAQGIDKSQAELITRALQRDVAERTALSRLQTMQAGREQVLSSKEVATVCEDAARRCGVPAAEATALGREMTSSASVWSWVYSSLNPRHWTPEIHRAHLLAVADPRAAAELAKLDVAAFRAMYPEGGPLPNSLVYAARAEGFADFAKSFPREARLISDASGVIEGLSVRIERRTHDLLIALHPAERALRPNPELVARLQAFRDIHEMLARSAPAQRSLPADPRFVLMERPPDGIKWLPEVTIRPKPSLDHNYAFTGWSELRPNQVIVRGEPLQSLDGVLSFGAHGSRHGFVGLETRDAAKLVAEQVLTRSKSGRPIEHVVLESCSQRDRRWFLGGSNAQEFQKELNVILQNAGHKSVNVLAPAHPGPVTAVGHPRRVPEVRRDGVSVKLDWTLKPVRYTPASDGARFYMTTKELAQMAKLTAAGVSGGVGVYQVVGVPEDLKFLPKGSGAGRTAIINSFGIDADLVDLAHTCVSGGLADYAIPSGSFANGAETLLKQLGPKEKLNSLHFFGHGSPGVMDVGSDFFTSAAFDPSHPDYALLLQLRERLTPGAVVQFAGCEVFKGAEGEAFAMAAAEFFGCEVAGYTEIIPPWWSQRRFKPAARD